MEARVAKLEAVIPTLATKEDVLSTKADILRLEAKLHQELHSLTWKLIGTCAGLVAVVYFLARTIH